jgi:hypothetical protein
MQRFPTWAGWIAAIFAVGFFIVKDVIAPVLVDFIKKQPGTDDAIHTALKFVLDLVQQPWLQVAGWIFVGLAGGLWLAWVLQKLDGSHAKQRETLGTEMDLLGHGRLDLFGARPEIDSCFIAARKLGIWAPDQHIFTLHIDFAAPLIKDYLLNVGTRLKNGHFREAKQYAEVNSKAAFDKAYAQFRLRDRPIR